MRGGEGGVVCLGNAYGHRAELAMRWRGLRCIVLVSFAGERSLKLGDWEDAKPLGRMWALCT